MKKLFFALAIMFVAAFSNAQTCSSPILLDGLNGGFTPVDSFSTQNRFFKFTANRNQQTIKALVKRLNSVHSGNIYLNLYSNNCGSLPTSQLTATQTISGDTIILNYSNFIQGDEYLIEMGKIINNNLYIAYNIKVNNGYSNVTWGCFGGGSCPGNLPCEYICNGNFEFVTATPTNFGQISNAFNWGDASAGTSDLISSLSPPSPVNASCNYAGSQSPFVGSCATNNNYSSSFIETNYTFNTNATEYIQTQLTSTLQAGKTYVVSFYISKGEHSNGNLNSLAIWLTPNQINSPGQAPITIAPSAITTNTTLLNNTTSWVNIKFCYYSVSGGENYLTIGRPNGSLVSLTAAPTATCSQYFAAQANTAIYYMYIDEVSLKPFDVLATSNTPSVNVCGVVNLNASVSCSTNIGALNYSWTGPNLSNSNIQNPTANVVGTSNYNVQITGFDSNNQTCSANSSTIIVSNTLSPLSLSSSANTVCPNSTVSISGSLSGGTGSYTYNPGGNIGNGIIFTPSVTTTYTVSGTGAGGCIQTKTITIYTYTSTIGVSASPAAICTGFNSTLTASNGSGYTWLPSGSGTSIVVSPTVTTTYTVTGTTTNGCIRSNTVAVTVNNPSAISISPSSTNSICLNSSINLVASGALTYTWQPGNVVNASNLVSPTVNSIYTVSATNSFGCIGTKTASVFIYSLPTVVCSLTSASVCPNVTTTLNSSGAVSYTWFPGNIIAQNPVVSQSVNTTYTVIGTSAQGCTNNCIVTQGVYPPNNFTVTATPSVVCGTTGGGPSTLIATPSSPSTYTWLPSNTASYSLAVTSSSVSSPVYTVVSTSSLGCIGTKTIQVGVSDGYAALGPFADLCTTSTLNLGAYANPYPGGTFSVNGVASGTLFSQPPGTYTIAFTNTTALLCNQSATAAIQVFSVPATPTITASSTSLCGGQSLTLTANPVGGAPTYSWSSTTFTGNPYISTPTTSATYTVIAINGACSSTSSAEFNVSHSPLPCACVQNCSVSLTGTITSSLAPNQLICLTGDLFISGNVTISNSDFKISPNVTITVLPSSTLNITGCHLYACDNMWQGIIVKQGGKLNITAGTRTSFIEDAFVAVDILTTSSTYTATNILNVDNVTFNRNQIGIRIGDYVTNQTPYPFTIQNNLFTSRTLTFTNLSYQNTSTIKNSVSGNTSSLQTPYISNSSYPALGLKAPLAGAMPDNGIVLTEVGYTNSNSSSTTFYGITIGNSTVAANFNCFDNLRQDITATNSNLMLSNNYFQEGQRYGRGLGSGGKAIVANSAAVGLDVKGARNNQIQIISVSTNTALNNRFYEKVSCADINGYINIEVKNAQAYSYANNYSGFTLINPIGDRGFNVVTNRYFNIIFDNNRIYNIKNAMLTGIDNASQWFASGTGNYGRMVGKINVTNNIVNRHPVSAVAGEFVNVGFSLSDPFSSATTNIALTGSSNFIQGNNFTNMHNGIAVANIAFSSVSIYSNNITLVNEPSSLGAPIQNGIYTTQLGTSVIQQNNIAGPTTFTNDISAIKTSMNNLLTVKCNTTANTYHGLNFNASQAVTTVQDNIMQNQKYGISMTNSATIGTQGTSTWPTNNQWLGSWTGNFRTMNYNQYSTAINSKIYATWGGTLDPNGSGTVIATPGAMFLDNYFHLPFVDPSNTILNSSAINPSCRAGGGGGSEGGSGFAAMSSPAMSTNTISLNQKTLLENLVNNASLSLANEVKYIDRNRIYRTLDANNSYTAGSITLGTFYSNAQNSCMNKFLEVEKDLCNGNIAFAQNKLAAISPTNNIENNYNAYYNLYIKLKNATFNSADSSVLLNLCNQCPYTEGGVVYQARALFNIMNNSFARFNDNCNLSVGSRLFDNIVKDDIDVNVLIKTKLYPNPNNGEFTVEVNKQTEGTIDEITIYDLGGKILYTNLESGSSIKVNTKLLKGSYLVKVTLSNNSVDVHRIIID